MARKILLACGVASSVLYVATDVVGAAVYPGYRYVDQTISELSALGAPSRAVVTPLFSLYPLLVMLFAAGVWLVAENRRVFHVIAVLLGLYALACIPFAPMHTREALAAGGATWTDTMHVAITAVDALLLVAIIALGAATARPVFRACSVVTLVVIAVSGMLAGTFGPAIRANEPTPWVGVAERIAVLGAMVWLAAFAATLLRTGSLGGRAPRRRLAFAGIGLVV